MRASNKAERFADLVLGGGAVCCIAVLLYVFYGYGWTGKKHFASTTGMLAYYVFPGMLAALWLACLQLRREYKINLAVLSLSTFLSLYAAELFLAFSSSAVFPPGALTGPGNARSEREKAAIVKLAKQFEVEFDTRSKLEVIDDLRRQGVDAFPNVFPRSLLEEQEDGSLRSAVRMDGVEILPLAGISNKVTVLCNETGAYTMYYSDEHGFHNPAGIWSLDRLDIAAVGDSFAHGACVTPDENFITLIRMRYPATLNLSMSGNGPLLELASLKEYLPRFRPKVVLWFYFEGNDLGELTRKIKSPLLKSYLQGDFNQGLRARQEEIDEALVEYVEKERILEIQRQKTAGQKTWRDILAVEEILKLSALREKFGLVYGDALSNRETPSTVDAVNTLGEILSQAKASVEAWNGQLYVVYLPEWDRYARPEFANKDRERVLRLLETLNIPVIDLHPAFQAQADPLSLFPFRRFGHYNKEGNRLVADTILRSVSVKRPLRQSESLARLGPHTGAGIEDGSYS